MIKEAIGFGSTVDEAKEDAILRLGAKIEEDIQFEIISLPKKKVNTHTYHKSPAYTPPAPYKQSKAFPRSYDSCRRG